MRQRPRNKAGEEHREHDARALQYGRRARVGVPDNHHVGYLAQIQSARTEYDETGDRTPVAQHSGKPVATERKQKRKEQKPRARHAHHRDERRRNVVVRQQKLRARARKAPQGGT